jgi:acetyl-CoA carboxylase beta subunit
VTRARDRLYLAAAVKDGAFKPGRGSLGEVLPKRFAGRFEAAVRDPLNL